MSKEQIVVGGITAILCLAGLRNHRWLLANTRHGRRLAKRFGEPTSVWIVRILLVAGAVFGVLLAANVVRPVQW